MLDKLYLEIRDKWNELLLKDADPEIVKFLVHLMDELEVMIWADDQTIKKIGHGLPENLPG